MGNTRTTWDTVKGILLILAVIGIILFFAFECHRDITTDTSNRAPKDAYKYKTSYIYKDEYFALKDSLKNLKPIKPLIIEKWLSPDSQVIDSVSIIQGYLKIHPQGEKEVLVNSDFIINYPYSPKLLSLKLSQDSLSLSIYRPSNEIENLTYPLYLGSYKYTWVNDTLGMVGVEEKKIREKVKWNNLFLNGGYDVYNKVPTTGFEYNLNLGRIKLDLNTEVLLMHQPELNLNAKMGYRLLR